MADLTQIGTLLIDDNDKPFGPGVVVSSAKTLVGNNTTINVPIFHITGTVQIIALWGTVTTTLGANNTAAYWRLNDQSAQVNITLNTGTTLSTLTAGSVIVKKGLAAAALVSIDAAAGRISEPTTLETIYFSPFVATQKAGATTDIEFTYSTTDTPTSGAITFYAMYLPIGSGSKITAA